MAVGFRWRWPALSRRRLSPACRGPISPPTGSPETVTHLRLPQNVACGFLALRSSERASQHSECLKLPVWQGQAWSL